MTQITAQPLYINDPTTSRSIFNGSLFFGLPDTDPQITSNQKLVRALQEDGTLVTLTQPVSTNSGGNPTLNGSPVVLDISGDYSYTALNKDGGQVFNIPRIENIEAGSAGFSGVVIVEKVVLTAGQTTVVLTNLGSNESVFYLQTFVGDQGFLAKDIDYTITNSTTIELTQSYNAGDTIVARQNDPTGQLVPVNDDAEALLVFTDLTAAQASAVAGNLVAGETVTLNGNAVSGDGLGGDKYIVQVTGPADDGVNFLDLNGTLQLALQSNYYQFLNYSETIGTPQIAAGVMNINFDTGSTQSITLTENISNIVFINFNPDPSFSSTVTLRIVQDGVGSRGVTFPAIIKWAGGIVPSVSGAANAIDIFGFTTLDAGVTFNGFILGQAFS